MALCVWTGHAAAERGAGYGCHVGRVCSAREFSSPFPLPYGSSSLLCVDRPHRRRRTRRPHHSEHSSRHGRVQLPTGYTLRTPFWKESSGEECDSDVARYGWCDGLFCEEGTF